ncbi:holo-[acyl-carrier-protein] synthase [Yamadazyma tenuis]|uniref:holo-[acyl-carrier-protein] synthase n=1 Tax=Candida tenuis TaxID=2315449 RepID=UPI0027A01E07|nr:holo-[acyl-carrier-protein] synthase [Yamadazyma tenuis]
MTLLQEVQIEQGILLFVTYITPELYEWFQDDYNWETTLRLVPLRQQLELRNMADHSAKVKRLITRLFLTLTLNYVIHNHENDPWEPLIFSYNKYGKPSVPEASISFNSSTSNHTICIVINNIGNMAPIGVDLSHEQQKIDKSTVLEDFKAIFHSSEITQLQGVPDTSLQYKMFNQFWTLKEAFTKYLGYGLNVDLGSFWFDLHNEQVIDVPNSATEFYRAIHNDKDQNRRNAVPIKPQASE